MAISEKKSMSLPVENGHPTGMSSVLEAGVKNIVRLARETSVKQVCSQFRYTLLIKGKIIPM